MLNDTELQTFYRGRLRIRIEELHQAITTWKSGNGQGLQDIRLIAHSLKGSGTTYGFTGISAKAKQVEEAAPEQLDAALEQLLDELKAEAAKA